MRIQNNIMAMNTHRFYTINNNNVSKSAEKLSSGYRVNRAGDDAAGLAISEKMRAEIRGLTMASKNAQDGVSMVQTAEGALTEVQAMLQRMKEMAVQAASDSNEDEIDRPALDAEFQQLIDEIDDVAMTTTFNDMKLLDGSFQGKVIQIGSRTGNEMDISIGNMDAASLGLLSGVGGAAGVPAISGLDTETVAAEKNEQKVTIENLSAAVTGDKLSYTVNYTDADGNAQTAKLELTIDTTNKKLITAGGTEVTVADPAAIKADKELTAAIAAAANEDAGLSSVFKATAAADGVTFTAKTAGKNSAIDSVVASHANTGGAAAATLKTVADATGADAYEAIDMASVEMNAVFTVGGEKFAFVDEQADAVALGSDVNAVVVVDGTAGSTAADATAVAEMANLIEQKTGYKPTIGTDKDTADAASPTTGTFMLFKAPETTSASEGVNLLNQNNASKSIDICRDALNIVSSQRAELGAIQNRLEHKIKNLDNTVENVSAAEARIRDVDIAKEMTNFTKNNILSQAATAMLAQANSLPQGVLSLLQ